MFALDTFLSLYGDGHQSIKNTVDVVQNSKTHSNRKNVVLNLGILIGSFSFQILWSWPNLIDSVYPKPETMQLLK